MKIYKEKIDIKPKQIVSLPAYYVSKSQPEIKILDISVQNNSPVIWLLTDGVTRKQVKIISVMTGEDILEPIETVDYIGTYKLEDDTVIHIFIQELAL